MPSRRCPVCRKPFDPERSQALPFCSPRCRQIDLGHWLQEDYGLPSESEQPGEPEDSSEDEAEDETEDSV